HPRRDRCSSASGGADAVRRACARRWAPADAPGSRCRRRSAAECAGRGRSCATALSCSAEFGARDGDEFPAAATCFRRAVAEAHAREGALEDEAARREKFVSFRMCGGEIDDERTGFLVKYPLEQRD